jgi:hypothetical protein
VVYVVYVISALFIFLSVMMLFAYARAGQFGLLLMALTYGASGILALWIVHWWPLAGGFALVWLMRALGLEPPANPGPEDRS